MPEMKIMNHISKFLLSAITCLKTLIPANYTIGSGLPKVLWADPTILDTKNYGQNNGNSRTSKPVRVAWRSSIGGF
jgi:hypothetical protein